MTWFLATLIGEHGKKALQGVTDAIVAADTTTASAAQLEAMQQDMNHVAAELAKFRAEATKEQGVVNDAKARFDRMKAAGDALLARYNTETDDTKKAALEKSLNGLLTTTEGIAAELAQDQKDLDEATALVTETETIFNEKAEALRTAHATLTAAARDLEHAKLTEEHANMQAEHAAEVAGLRDNNVGSLNAAVTAMHRQADAARQAADAKHLTTEALTHVDHGSLDDPNVMAALAEVEHAPSTQSFAERLAALK